MKLLDDVIKNIQNEVKKDKVVLGVSGGVDSMVLAIILKKAIGKQLNCLYLDSGLNRHGEKEMVANFLARNSISLRVIDAKERILKDLKGKRRAREKKQAIKKIFNRIFYLYSQKIGAKFIAHGTNKGDSELLFKRKSRLINNFGMNNLEPFIKIRKNQIIEIGMALKLPNEILNKFSLSAWGLSRKILGEVTRKKLEIIDLLLNNNFSRYSSSVNSGILTS